VHAPKPTSAACIEAEGEEGATMTTRAGGGQVVHRVRNEEFRPHSNLSDLTQLSWALISCFPPYERGAPQRRVCGCRAAGEGGDLRECRAWRRLWTMARSDRHHWGCGEPAWRGEE
jgi:hypothetical protein